MITIKNFSIFKSKQSDNEKLPTHRINAKVGDEYVEVGSCWTKETSKGDKFLSARLATTYVNKDDRTKSRRAVLMVFEDELVELCKKAGVEYDFNEPQ